MRNKLWLIVAAVAALTLVGTSTFASPSRNGTVNKPWGVKSATVGGHSQQVAAPNGRVRTLVVNTRNERSRFIDNLPRQHFNQGDEIVVTAPAYRAGEWVGHLDGEGMVTSAQRGAIQITFTITIHRSQITSTGVIVGDANGFDAAVTGGTGHYFGASGAVHVTFTSNHSSRATFYLER
jgi:hypothetical protein